jgi:hypothetical protein
MPLIFSNLPVQAGKDHLKIAVAQRAHQESFLRPVRSRVDGVSLERIMNFDVFIFPVREDEGREAGSGGDQKGRGSSRGRAGRGRGRGGRQHQLISPAKERSGRITFAEPALERRLFEVCQSSPIIIQGVLIMRVERFLLSLAPSRISPKLI